MSSTLPPCFGVGSLASYTGLDQVGEGTYGYVYKAKDQKTGETVALKRLIFHKESLGFPLNAVREVKFLKCLQHKNIVQLKSIVNSKGCEAMEKTIKTDSNRSEDKNKASNKEQDRNGSTVLSLCGNLYLVFEFVEHDLGGLLDAKYKFSMREVKCIAKQLFEVLEFLSERKILHRDIKSSNILITNRHQVKLADFGLARSIQSADGRELRLDLTNNVVTMWYKAPELLLGAVRYAHSIDVWSTGCVLAELELGRPLFPGRTDIEQMDLICRTLGTPSESLWTGVQKMPSFDKIMQSMTEYTSSLRSTFSGKLSEAIIGLLERILVFDPTRRGSAKILLTNKYFLTQPLPPIDPSDLEPLNVSAGVSYHEYRTKQQKRQREQESKGGAAGAGDEPNSVEPSSKQFGLRPPPPPAPAQGAVVAQSLNNAGVNGGYGAPILPMAPYGMSAVAAPLAVIPVAPYSSLAPYGAPVLNHLVPKPPVQDLNSAGGSRFSGMPSSIPNNFQGQAGLPPHSMQGGGDQNTLRFNPPSQQAQGVGYGHLSVHNNHNTQIGGNRAYPNMRPPFQHQYTQPRPPHQNNPYQQQSINLHAQQNERQHYNQQPQQQQQQRWNQPQPPFRK